MGLRWKIILVLLAINAGAQESVTLAWDRSPSPEACGYNVYFGTNSLGYSQRVNASTNLSVQVCDLKPDVTYRFAATCYDQAGLESAFSPEVTYKTIRAGTNRVVTVSLATAPTSNGPWTVAPGAIPVTVTNPTVNVFFKLTITNHTQ
jgi:hypothetical protein